MEPFKVSLTGTGVEGWEAWRRWMKGDDNRLGGFELFWAGVEGREGQVERGEVVEKGIEEAGGEENWAQGSS